MATKPPAKAAPKSAGKAATKPAAKTAAAPAKKAPAKKPVSSIGKKLSAESGNTEPQTTLEDAHLGMQQAEEMGENMRKYGTIDKPADPAPWEDAEAAAEQQAELNSLSALMASARADITPNDTDRPEPAPTVPKYSEAVNVRNPVPTSGPGSLSMSAVLSARKKPTTRPVSPAISRLLNLR